MLAKLEDLAELEVNEGKRGARHRETEGGLPPPHAPSKAKGETERERESERVALDP